MRPPEKRREEYPLPAEGETKRKPKRPLPDAFPSAELIEEQQAKARAAGANLDISNQAERFRNGSISNDSRYVDWTATWRNWCDRAIREAPKTATSSLAARQAPAADDHWRRRVREFKRNRYWPGDDAGPRPGREGRRVPFRAAVVSQMPVSISFDLKSSSTSTSVSR